MTRKEIIDTGKWSLGELEDLIRNASSIPDPGERTAAISARFLGVRYLESTLSGSTDAEEIFTINLAGVDCFTLIDYVEAMRLSGSFTDFRGNLKKVRYKNGILSFGRRNHFFSDWIVFNADRVEEVASVIAPGKTRLVRKQLNIKEDGRPLIAGVKAVQRDIKYIPSLALDAAVMERFKTGDYIGVYSGQKGLDVSHTGIIIKTGNTVIFRHASSKSEYRMVVDQDFAEYASSRPGIVVIRPKTPVD
jgi:hypothetical protein